MDTKILQTFIHRDKLLLFDSQNAIYNLEGKFLAMLSTAVLPQRTVEMNVNFVSYKNRSVGNN